MDNELSNNTSKEQRKVSVGSFVRMKSEGEKIVMVTAYDYPSARIADQAGVDVILVGDSYGMVVLGYETTIPVTVDDLLPVCRAVRRGASHPLLIGDLPFMSFQASQEDAVRTAGRFVKEGSMEAVKVEGGASALPAIEAISNAGIPVLAHIGVTPQTAPLHGGYRIQGKSAEAGAELIKTAVSLEAAGAFGIVLEMVTEDVAKIITQTVSIPIIGIGAGRFCDGQVLVIHDILGFYPKFTPKFAKQYADVGSVVRQALEKYANDVRNATFPEEKNVFRMEEDQRLRLDAQRKN